MKRISMLIIIFVLCAIPAWAIYQSSTFGNRSGTATAGCAGGIDGDTGAPGASVSNGSGTDNDTNNILYVYPVTISSANDGDITRAHWDTYSAANSTAAGIWDNSGNFIAGTAAQAGANGQPDTFNVDLTTTCLADGSTYYIGVWIQADAFAGIYIADNLGTATSWIYMPTFGSNFNPASLTAFGSTRKLQLRLDNV